MKDYLVKKNRRSGFELAMDEWTNEERYRPYHEWDEKVKTDLEKKTRCSIWRQEYHIQPQSGLLNDPNGFSFFNGKWHLFYQSFPYGTIHGLKSWFHMESLDLVLWEPKGTAIVPGNSFDSHGVYSGSAINQNNNLILFYTGNVRDDNWNRHSFQLQATMDVFGNIKKQSTPLIDDSPDGYTQHFRDPQVFYNKDSYYMIIGAQSKVKMGKILIYKSSNLKNWHLVGPLNFTNKPMGYMIECPHLVNLKKDPVLLFCPQGLDKSIAYYANENPNCYLVGQSVDLDSGNFISNNSIQLLDDGFDVYATQAMDMPDGRTLAVSWLGLPESSYPVTKDGWTNCLSLVKQLVVKENHLYQYPVSEIKQYQELIHDESGSLQSKKVMHSMNSNSYEYELTISNDSFGTLSLLADEQLSRALKISFNAISGEVIVDRSLVGEKIIETTSIRKAQLKQNEKIKLNIFVDRSSVEIFINDGFKVVSLLTFPKKKDTFICLEGTLIMYQEKIYSINLKRKSNHVI